METRSFVIQQNIERYRQLLETTKDQRERTLILQLLAEAKAKQQEVDGTECRDPLQRP